jgi:chaperone required for assembly of F1-ATPase
MTRFKNAPNSLYRPRRFYTDVAVVDGTITLDGKPVKTPNKTVVQLDPRVAELIAAEWQAQVEWIDPSQMPLTRLVNSAIDRDAEETPVIVDEVLRYLETDLTLYRAEGPADLVAAQAAAWDAPLARFNAAFAASLTPTTDLTVTPVDPDLSARMQTWVLGLHPITRAAVGRLVGMVGSAVLTHDAVLGCSDAQAVFAAARVDEDHQISRWGADDEAAEAAANVRTEMLSICALIATMSDTSSL